MTDFVAQIPPGTNGSVYVRSSDQWNSGVSVGDGCVSNGARVACIYRQSWNAVVVYDGNGNTLWTSQGLIDNHSYSGMPIMQADGSLIVGDDQHIYGFNPDGSVAWVTQTPGGTPIGLVPTPNGAIVSATDGQTLSECFQLNCTLIYTVSSGGSGYTAANVLLAGGDCPGAAATATVSSGAVTAVTVTSQGSACLIPPDAIITGNGQGAYASGAFTAAAPVAVYSGAAGNTGALLGSLYLYQTGSSGPYYTTINTPCVNNGSYPNRLYVLTNLNTDNTQGALWALDIDPTNLVSPITPVWDVVIHGPSGASPLCVGNYVYFDGAGIVPGDDVGTTIFGVEDNGASGSFLFQQALGPGTGAVTCNFALDPRPEGGFWHQLQYSPDIFHRNFLTGNLIESIDVSNLLTAAGAPPSTYWQAGVFTTYGTASQPYMMLPEASHPQGGPGYLAMVDIAAQSLVWAVPLAGNDTVGYDSPGGDAVLVLDSNSNPVIVMSGKETAAYFITNGGAMATLSLSELSFGPQIAGTTSSPLNVALTNAASAPLTITSITAGGPFTETNTCPATLAPGVECSITVVFSPALAGSQTGLITIASNSQNSPQTVALTGVGTASMPVVSLSANQLVFATQAVGTISPPQSVTLTNAGTLAMAVSSIATSGAAAESNNCPASLPPSASCTIYIMLAAPLNGACSGMVTIATSAPGGAQTIPLTGVCVALPPIESALSTSSLVFVPQTSGTLSAPQAVSLTNIGSVPLAIASIISTGDVTQTNNCGAILAVGASCTISVVFAPSAIGPRTGAITVTDAAPDSPHVISIFGAGLPNPVPVVNQPLVPSAIQPGAAGLVLTVNGTGFVSGSVVYWNGAPRITSYVSNSQLSATLTTADLASFGTGSVSVVNPIPGGGQSNLVWLPVAYPSPAPVLGMSMLQDNGSPSAIVAADLNADGKIDLAVTNSAANTVSIYLGNGDGTFAVPVNYATGRQPMAISVGDVNHDGIPDLVVANQSAATVSVLLGAGGGTFQQQLVYATGNQPAAVIIADLNADGNLDLAVANFADDTVSILTGNGAGVFGPHLDYPAGPSPRGLATGDFNGDGKLDLAVGNDITANGTVTVLLNHGDGSYLPGVSYATGDSVSLVTADFNGDGILDFAAVNEAAQTLSLYLGTGSGSFALGPAQTERLSPDPMGLAAADMNADGTLEILTANNSVSGLVVLVNNDDATMAAVLQYGEISGGVALATGDFNNDGSIDTAVALPLSNGIAILLQAPALALSASTLNFGNVAAGAGATQTFTISNSGSAMLNVTNISVKGTFTQTNNCAGWVAPGGGCTINVTFSPPAAGPQNSLLTIQSNVPGAAPTVNLLGTGAAFTVNVGLAQNSVVGGSPLNSNTANLSAAAPAGGSTVLLTSSNPAVASVPASVVVAAGATASAAFPISTTGVVANTPVTITANVNGVSGSSVLTVNPIGVAFTLSATSVDAGVALANNTLTLTNAAPAGGLVFNLSTANPSIASVPASVSVAAGATVSAPFTITTVPLASSSTATIFASLSGLNGNIAYATVDILAVVPTSLALSQAGITGGLSTTTNVVNLSAPAPPGGVTVSLSSSRPSIAVVPATVTVPANASASMPFTITAGYVPSPTPVTITATYNLVNVTSVVTINPDGVASLNLSSTQTVGGSAPVSQNTITLLSPASKKGAAVQLSSSDPAVVSVPASVRIAAGSTKSPAFKITTQTVTVTTPVTISATYGGATASAVLTVNPLGPSIVTLPHQTAIGGKTAIGNTVTLNAAAPAGGVVVSLTSSNPAVAMVPATVTIAGGTKTSPTFSINTSVVTAQTPVTISATYQGVTATATLTVKP